MAENELEVLHEIDFKMMQAVLEIFERHDLKYFLIAGTLLGAVRHKGFIPWDDDLDIGVPREAYEEFLNKYAMELPARYRVQNYQNDPDAKYYITRVLDTETKVQEIRDTSSASAATYASIDLFPIDGTPNNAILRKIFIFRIMFLRMLASMSESNNIDMHRKRGSLEKLLVIIAKLLPFEKVIKRQSVFKRVDRLLSIYSMEDSDYIGSLMGAYRSKELFEAKFVKRLAKVSFEGKLFSAPADWDGYLKHMYGDYMQIPPVESIQAKRHYKITKGLNK